MRDVFLHGWKIGMQQWRIAAIVYFIQLCLALTLGMQVYEVLQASIGHSLEIRKLLANYDHTVLTDFLKVHGASITPLIGQLRWLLLVWLVFSVFMNAGMLCCANNPGEASGRTFWQGGATNFFPFLKISLFVLTLALAWTALLLLPILSFLQPSLQYFSSEKYTVWLMFLVLALCLKGLAVLYVWSVISRLQYLKTGAGTISCLKSGWRFFWKNKFRFLALLAGFALLQLVLIAAYFLLEAFTGMTSPFLILFLFVVQQLFVLFRIQIRLMIFAGIGILLTKNIEK